MTTHTQVEAKSTSAPIPAMQPAHSGFLPQQEQEESDRSSLSSEDRLRSPNSPTPPPLNPSVGHSFGSMAIGPMSSPVLQRKLAIGQPNDRYEQEADRVADQVMRMPAPKVQRLCPECKDELQRQPIEEEEKKKEEETLQTKPLAESITPLIQRQTEPTEEEKKKKEEETLQTKPASGEASTVSPALQNQIAALQGGGQPLPESERHFFEPRFGTDFSQVRVHADGQAAEAARAVNARAFTLGRDVVFGAGEYQPRSTEGQKLLAHELTHVIQQGQSSRQDQFVQRQPRRPRRRRTPTVSQTAATQVRDALAQTPPDFTSAPLPPTTQGGAFYVLNGLNPTDIIDTLRVLTTAQRNLLLSNVELADGLYDRPRLELALRASLVSNRENGIKAVSMLDAIRNAGTGSFAAVFTPIQGLPRARVQAILGLFDLDTVRLILSHISDAPAASRNLLTQTATRVVHQTLAQQVRQALEMNPPDFQSNPNLMLPLRSQAPYGGAYYILNGLNPSEMVGTLGQLTPTHRASLFRNLDLAQGLYDRPRLELGIRAAITGNPQDGIQALTLLDAIRNAGTGSLAAAFGLIATLPRSVLLNILSLFDPAILRSIQPRIATDADPASQQRLTEAFADILGTPPMTASDVIDLALVRGALNQKMARIYNRYGQLIFNLAQTNNFATHVLAGVMKVEAGGQAFDVGTDRAIIRFEAHVFWNRWGHSSTNRTTFNQHFDFKRTGRHQDNHRFRENPTDAWQTFHGNQQREQQALALATRLSDAETANQCMSIGTGQVMGFNFALLGFTSATEMLNAFNVSERSQTQGMVSYFVNKPGLPTAIRAQNYDEIARLYNGSNNVARYSPDIQAAAEAYLGVTAGRRFVR